MHVGRLGAALSPRVPPPACWDDDHQLMRALCRVGDRPSQLLRFPGLGVQLGARVLAEIGDDRSRFADARGLKAYAGVSPITRASGKESSIIRRWVNNDRFNAAGCQLQAEDGLNEIRDVAGRAPELEAIRTASASVGARSTRKPTASVM